MGRLNIQTWLDEQLGNFEWPKDLTILVCGGRDFSDVETAKEIAGEEEVEEAEKERYFLWDVLSRISFSWSEGLGAIHNKGVLTLAEGEARGADKSARLWLEIGIEMLPDLYKLKPYPADWKKHGKSAGSIRNQLMLFDSKPHLVVAFPGGRGTADMVRKAKRAGVKVLEVPYEN